MVVKTLLLLGVLVCCSAPVFAKAKIPSMVVDQDYVNALAAANRFLQAWQTQDHETALLMLTDTAKRHSSEDRLQSFFSPRPATRQAYEIGRGRKLKPGRYTFPVALFAITASSGRSLARLRFSQIVVVRTGKEDWAIDKLP